MHNYFAKLIVKPILFQNAYCIMSENSSVSDAFAEIDGSTPEIEVSNEVELADTISPLDSGHQSPASSSTSEFIPNASLVDNLFVSSTSSTDSTYLYARRTSNDSSLSLQSSPPRSFRWSQESIISNSPVFSSILSSRSSTRSPSLWSGQFALESPASVSPLSDMSVPSPISVSSESTIDYIDIDSENVSVSVGESEFDDNDSETLTEPFVGFNNDQIENGDIHVIDSDQLEESTNDEDDVSVEEEDENSENPPVEFANFTLSIPEQSTNIAGEILTVTGEEEVKTSPSEQKLLSSSACGVKRPADDEDDDESGQTCMICMDVWSNSGDHRLSSLKCGHLFGHSCIVRWLQVAKTKVQRRCPQCNLIASIRDVRILYAKKLVAIDTVEKDRIKKKLEETEKERNKLELDLKKSELITQHQARQLQDLEARLAASTTMVNHNSVPGKSSAPQPLEGTGNINLVCEHTVEICKDGGCRILAYKESLNLLVASQRSANALFSGYGISKMNSLDFRPTQFIFLHTKPIRDLAFHTSDNDLLLSVSLDKCAKLMDISSNGVVQNFQTGTPLWSCCWDIDNSNIFFVGGQDGSVIQYDIRKTGAPVCRISRGDNERAVTSIATMPSNPGGPLPRGGFIACHLNSCWAYEKADLDYVGKELPLDGPFFSMRYDKQTDHILASMRPSQRSIRARHVVCELDRSKTTNSLTCNEIQSFDGSLTQSVISRPCQMKIAGYGSVVASHLESSSSIVVWNLANGNKVCSHPASEAILDTCPINVNQKQYLGTVSDKTLRVYRVVPK